MSQICPPRNTNTPCRTPTPLAKHQGVALQNITGALAEHQRPLQNTPCGTPTSLAEHRVQRNFACWQKNNLGAAGHLAPPVIARVGPWRILRGGGGGSGRLCEVLGSGVRGRWEVLGGSGRPAGPQAHRPAGPQTHRPAGPQARRAKGPQARRLGQWENQGGPCITPGGHLQNTTGDPCRTPEHHGGQGENLQNATGEPLYPLCWTILASLSPFWPMGYPFPPRHP